MTTIRPVILCGGTGTRLWPLSRKLYPKQFLKFLSDRTIFQETMLRLGNHPDYANPIVVCNEEHRFIAGEQLKEINVEATIILEPEGKNTAPATLLAMFHAEEDDILLVLPADHYIENAEFFNKSIASAVVFAQNNKLITFGIHPAKPETGYGYILTGKELQNDFYTVEKFIEKPKQATANQFVKSKKYLWNSGIFMFKIGALKEEAKKYAPKMYSCCERAMANNEKDDDFIRPSSDEFKLCPSDSIDYAIMEKTSNSVVMRYQSNWSDLGSWTTLYEQHTKDENNNCLMGDVVAISTKNTFINAEKRLIAAIGLDDLIIIDTADAVLVANKNHAQEVKKVVQLLSENKRSEEKHHKKVYRPWGNYETIDLGSRYQVKRISVKPGAKLSLQMHYHRAEHWVVVSGTALVTREDEEFLLSENESVYIPIGKKHRLENPTQLPLEIIEVQSGSYLGEDDIVRFEDIYKREKESVK